MAQTVHFKTYVDVYDIYQHSVILTDCLHNLSDHEWFCWELISSISSAFPSPLFSPESVHADFSLQTDSGFRYVNSLHMKMLSMQTFMELQKEEVVNKLKRRNRFAKRQLESWVEVNDMSLFTDTVISVQGCSEPRGTISF